jgi:TP901-1 family phage major tail protein
MAAQKGSAYLLKIDISSTFTTIAGMKSVRIRQGRNVVDVTNADSSNLARELLTTAGTRDCSISFTGVFTDAATDSSLQTDYIAGTLRDFQVVIPGFGTYEGGFIITSLEHNANFDAGGEFSIELMSGDSWAFTAE